MTAAAPHRVLIAGGGVAGLEALIALRSLAGDRVDLTLVSPDDEFVVRALSVEDPFARPAPARHSVERICAEHGATFVRDALHAVHRESSSVTTRSGEEIAYDSLLVAIGAHATPVFDHVTTFRGLQDAEGMHGLVQDVEGGYTTQVAFVVPSGVTWSLPLYELALMTAERASSLCLDVNLSIVTPEEAPLAIFGREASEAVDRVLQDAGVAVFTSTHVSDVADGAVLGAGGDPVVRATRVVALPRLEGPRVRGLPHDGAGFVHVDDHGAVPGVDGVFAAGDGTTFPVKQGGIAAQQADAAARAIAARAGADVRPVPFRPVLRAQLLTGTRSKYLTAAIAGGAGDGASSATDHSLWWPPAKVAAPYLAPYLERAGSPTPAP